MGKRSYFYTFVVLAWIFLGIFLSKRLFGDDSLAEVVTVSCLVSIGTFISFATEYFIQKLVMMRKNE